MLNTCASLLSFFIDLSLDSTGLHSPSHRLKQVYLRRALTPLLTLSSAFVF